MKGHSLLVLLSSLGGFPLLRSTQSEVIFEGAHTRTYTLSCLGSTQPMALPYSLYTASFPQLHTNPRTNFPPQEELLIPESPDVLLGDLDVDNDGVYFTFN